MQTKLSLGLIPLLLAAGCGTAVDKVTNAAGKDANAEASAEVGALLGDETDATSTDTDASQAPGDDERLARVLKQFDANGNGELDASELKAMMAASGHMGEDGRVGPKEKHGRRGPGGPGHGHGGPGERGPRPEGEDGRMPPPPPPRGSPENLFACMDANADGNLTQAEWLAGKDDREAIHACLEAKEAAAAAVTTATETATSTDVAE